MNETAQTHSAAIGRVVHAEPLADLPHSCAPTIAESWRRCVLQYALEPTRRRALRLLDAHALAQRRAQHAELLQIASAEIDELHAQITQSGYAVVLSDASGTVLYRRASEGLDQPLRIVGLVPGADWSEPCAGTNGIGTCIAANRAVTVHRGEHFHDAHAALCCSGVPIYDAAGTLLAVLDASTLNAHHGCNHQAHTIALVSRSAALIEKRLFLQQHAHCRVLRFHASAAMVALEHDGAVAVADDGGVIAADQTAQHLLGMQGTVSLVGRDITAIFDLQLHDFARSSRSSGMLLRPVRDIRQGRCFFATIVPPSVVRGTAAPNAARLTPRCAQQPAAAPTHPGRTLEALAGDDPQMLRNVRSARRIADSQVAVMIQGPTGTGKELFARALHMASCRASGAFVALNCAALPEALIESELFGYQAGAFTGAHRDGLKGKLLLSSGGTLFLDEIGDMPLTLQTRLLRVLEEQEVVPLGAETPLKVDLRVICASHQNLRRMLVQGRFRADLYYRLNGITLELPALAHRSDKMRLIQEFLTAEAPNAAATQIEPAALRCLLNYTWPGNLRELRNVIRTAIAICDSGRIRLQDLPAAIRVGAAGMFGPPSSTQDLRFGPLQAAEREALTRILREHEGNVSRAALALGISRNTLYRHCKRLRVDVLRTRRTLSWLDRRPPATPCELNA